MPTDTGPSTVTRRMMRGRLSSALLRFASSDLTDALRMTWISSPIHANEHTAAGRRCQVPGVALARKRTPHRTRLLRRRFARGLYARHLQGDPEARACLKRLAPDYQPFSSSQGRVL